MRKRLLFAALFTLAGLCAQARGQEYPNYAPPGAAYPPGPYQPAAAGPYAQVMQGPYGPGAQGPYGPAMQAPCCPAPAAAATDCCGESCHGTCGDYHWDGFADFLYMRPRNANVAYGVVFNGPTDVPPAAAAPIQVSPVSAVDIDYQPAWRVGIARALDECSAVEMTYTHFQGGGDDSLSTSPPLLIRSEVSQPSAWISNSLSDSLSAEATQHMLFDLGDVDYRWTFASSQQYSLTLLGGGRYCNFDQDFLGTFATGEGQTVQTHINFQGAGIRIGLEGEHRGAHGFFVYGRGTASFVAGDARSTYVQTDFGLPTVETGYHSDRIVTMLDAEVGIGWMGPNERFRVMGGYMMSGWFNALTTNDLVQAVQTNNFAGSLGSTLAFDGFFGRAEYRF